MEACESAGPARDRDATCSTRVRVPHVTEFFAQDALAPDSRALPPGALVPSRLNITAGITGTYHVTARTRSTS